MKENRAVIITGMHRSGTSFVSSVLQKAGLNIGNNLLGPLRGNPRGHFEDIDFNRYHANILRRFEQSILVQTTEALGEITAVETNQALALIEQRQNNQVWGWKDPRTALFLDFWHRLLPQVCYVFIYRHPLEVALSLLKRGTEVEALANPISGLRSWLVYNQAISNFYRQHHEICLLCHISGIVENIEGFINLTEKKLQLPLRQGNGTQMLYHSDELKRLETVSAPDVISVLKQIIPEVIELYTQLEAQADLPDPRDNQIATQRSPQLAKLSQIVPELIPGSAEAKTVGPSILSLLLSILDPQVALAREVQTQNLTCYIDALEESHQEQQATLTTIYQTRAWRVVSAYWRFKKNISTIFREIRN